MRAMYFAFRPFEEALTIKKEYCEHTFFHLCKICSGAKNDDTKQNSNVLLILNEILTFHKAVPRCGRCKGMNG